MYEVNTGVSPNIAVMAQYVQKIRNDAHKGYAMPERLYTSLARAEPLAMPALYRRRNASDDKDLYRTMNSIN